ncbi:MAG: L-serine ammonia-lyase, iron-sulfur-dependent, subunit alpha, partial [Bacilli bacterium]
KGHLTDFIIKKMLGENNTEVRFMGELFYEYHPNGMKFYAYLDEQLLGDWLVFSVGGGALKELNEDRETSLHHYYRFKTMKDILHYLTTYKLSFIDYVIESEPSDILLWAEEVINVMFASVERGFANQTILPGPLKIKRRASSIYEKYLQTNDFNALIFAATLAVSEENAGGGLIVTAPTCGSSGVLPGVLYAYHIKEKIAKQKLAKALLVGGLFGNLVKENASISGAEVGCQGEIGTACSMAAAALCYLHGGTNQQIEYAAEIALEHHLGMTCDPVLGYVQIPCIERNAISAKRAIDACEYALLTDGKHFIDFDSVVTTLKETGKDLNSIYRETSLGGLAKVKIESD